MIPPRLHHTLCIPMHAYNTFDDNPLHMTRVKSVQSLVRQKQSILIHTTAASKILQTQQSSVESKPLPKQLSLPHLQQSWSSY